MQLIQFTQLLIDINFNRFAFISKIVMDPRPVAMKLPKNVTDLPVS